MKNVLKKVLTFVTAITVVAVTAVALPAKTVKADSGVTIFYQNSRNWSVVNCYTWQGSGGTGADWPGSQMTSVGNGWYKFVYTGTKPLNLIFTNGDGSEQTGNQTPADLSSSASAYWITNTNDVTVNPISHKTNIGVAVSNSPQAGWPTLSGNTSSTTSSGTTASSGTTGSKTGGTTSGSSTAKKGSATNANTGDNSNITMVAIVAVAALSGACLVLLRKKSKA